TLTLSCSSSLPCYAALLPLHSFPTRRSSDLCSRVSCSRGGGSCSSHGRRPRPSWRTPCSISFSCGRSVCTGLRSQQHWSHFSTRSEEHTSELQSRSDLVCRLLLEKIK